MENRGSKLYIAPKLFQQKYFFDLFVNPEKTDIWTLGISFY
jgi:serine/threonine protein kinase